MVELVVLTPDDWQLWRRLRLRALADAPSAFGSRLEDWQHATEERWRDRLALTPSLNLVATLGGAEAGMATGAVFDGVHELIGMWVAPEARGRGVGDALVAEVVGWSVARGAPELRLDVVADNAHAIRLYVRHGFADAAWSREPGERTMVKTLFERSVREE